MQPAGKAVGRITVIFIELAAGVQLHKNDFDRRHAFRRMNFDGNAAPVIAYSHRTVAVKNDGDLPAITAERLVGRIVDGLLNNMQRTIGSRIHARTVANRLQTLENGNGFCGVIHR